MILGGRLVERTAFAENAPRDSVQAPTRRVDNKRMCHTQSCRLSTGLCAAIGPVAALLPCQETYGGHPAAPASTQAVGGGTAAAASNCRSGLTTEIHCYHSSTSDCTAVAACACVGSIVRHAIVPKYITGQHAQSWVDADNVTTPAHVHLHVRAQEEHSPKPRMAASERQPIQQ